MKDRLSTRQIMPGTPFHSPSKLDVQGPYGEVKVFRARIKKLRADMSVRAVLSKELAEAIRQIDQHLYAAECLADDLSPIQCCRNKPAGEAASCPACHGDRVTTRGNRKAVLGF